MPESLSNYFSFFLVLIAMRKRGIIQKNRKGGNGMAKRIVPALLCAALLLFQPEALYGGRIRIKSELGKGTIVWVIIPCTCREIVRK